MPLVVSDIRLPVTAEEAELYKQVAAACGVRESDIRTIRLLRRAIDARKKQDIHFNAQAVATLDAADERTVLQRHSSHIQPYNEMPETPLTCGNAPLKGRVVVAGLGPAGLFAAHTLAQYGYAPLVIERGEPVEKRVCAVEQFWNTGILNGESNVMFGEGGAGTFSDGKLTSRSKDPRQARVLRSLIRFGAPEEIGIDSKPHIGTDRLRSVVSAMRREIQSLGGEVRFSTRLSGLEMRDGALSAIQITCAGKTERIPCGALVLAIGQGARDTYRMLYESGVTIAKKPFAVGVRIEHPQSLIDAAQYGALAGHPRLGAASYALTGKSGTRGVYTFCMCPGGSVIASASEAGQVVVNGMSDYARDGENANAAIVVQVHDGDTPDHPLAGLQFIEDMERAAFRLGGGGMIAPAERVCDYVGAKTPTGFGGVTPSYKPGVRAVDIRGCLPEFVAQGVQDGIGAFARQLRGFDMGDAVLTAVETRTSAPLRIVRGADMQSVNCAMLYPVGENAKYADEIINASINRMRATEAIISVHAKP